MLSPQDSISTEQLQLPGMGVADPGSPSRPRREDGFLKPPDFPDVDPKVFKPEGGELSPWQKAQLKREYVRIADAAADIEIKRNLASADIRGRDEDRNSEHRDRDEQRQSCLENERWERLDRRVVRYAMLALFFSATLAAILLSFLGFGSGDVGARIMPAPVVVVAVVAAQRLGALSGSGRASIWDWLVQRREEK